MGVTGRLNVAAHDAFQQSSGMLKLFLDGLWCGCTERHALPLCGWMDAQTAKDGEGRGAVSITPGGLRESSHVYRISTGEHDVEQARVMAGFVKSVDVENWSARISMDSGEEVLMSRALLIESGLTTVELGWQYQLEAVHRFGLWWADKILAVFPMPYRNMIGSLVELPAGIVPGTIESEGARVTVSKLTLELSGFSWFEVGHTYAFQSAAIRDRLHAVRIVSRLSVN
jgi:hypothetical protein